MKFKELLYISLGYRLQNLSTKFKANSFAKKFGKLKIRAGNSDIRVFKQIFLDEVYHFIPGGFDPKVIVDAGANVGYSALWFSSKFPQAQVLAIEPELENFNLLVKNTAEEDRIVPLNMALWHEKTTLEIENPSADSWAFRVSGVSSTSENSVATLTITSLMEDFKLEKIDLLKIDIEGAEFELFQNGAERWLPFVNMIMIETHDRIKPGCSQLIDHVVNPFGFKKFNTKELAIYYKP